MAPPQFDRLPPLLRSIEKEIDNAYRANPLVAQSFATAGWNLLAFGEDIFLKPHISGQENTIHRAAVLADSFITSLTYPLHWLYSTCPSDGEPPFHCDNVNYQSAWNLMNLADSYKDFCSAFTYASRGLIELKVTESRLLSDHDWIGQSQYEAYNRLIKPSLSDNRISGTQEFSELIGTSLRIKGERFSYKLNRQLAKAAQQVIGPAIQKRFSLPDTWQFSRYALGDFRRVIEAVTAIAFTHWCARYLAATAGCSGLGYADSIFIPNREELLSRAANYSGVDTTIVSFILEDLTYGIEPGRMSDPALQPLIPLNPRMYAVMPNLWLNSSAERNLTVLLNRLPRERAIYSRLVDEKESLMKKKFLTSLSQQNLRFADGGIPGDCNLPDIDLAIIEDTAKTCILLELKWFIEPAEVREVIEKSEELKKGVRQLLALKRAFEQNHRQFFDKLEIDPTYTLYLVLASETWIGHNNVQDPNVSIIKASHILGKLNACDNLRETGEWLRSRQYLPTNAVHYEVVEKVSVINSWTLNWYGIKPLLTDEFFPL